MIRNILAALIGVFFIVAPWTLDFTDHVAALRTSLCLGMIQLLASLLAIGKSGWNSWQSWISLISGVGFIVFPFAFAFALGISILYILLGYTTVLLNYYSMNAQAK
jgi:hypothetical protein